MKVFKYLKSISLLGLIVPMVVSTTVFAQTTTDDSTTTDTTTTEVSTEKTIEERLAERKARIQTRLTTAQQTRLRARCQASQVIIRQFGGRVNSLEKNRKAAHVKIIERLNNVVAEVGDRADTTDLTAAIAELKVKTDAMDADLADYKQAVSDLAEMDCVADPTAFQATLSDLRTQRADLAKASAEIRAYVKDTIKPILQAIRDSLTTEEQ